MTAAQLADDLRRMPDAGELDPNAVFFRPACMCDEDVGYVEVRYIDQVRRMFSDAPAILLRRADCFTSAIRKVSTQPRL